MTVAQQERDACAQAIQVNPVAVSNALLDEIASLRAQVNDLRSEENVMQALLQDVWFETFRQGGCSMALMLKIKDCLTERGVALK